MSVLNSPLNHSTSKAKFSFGRDQRFLPSKPSDHHIYNKPDCLSKRSASIGYGNKHDICQDITKSPSPDRYMIPSEFNKHKKGISFGVSRESAKSVSIFKKEENPGPSDYQNTVKFPTKQYSMRSKIQLPRLFPYSEAPGPDGQQAEQFSHKGQQYVSKMKSSVSFSIKRTVQKENCYTTKAGPGSYKIDISSFGKQIQAKYKTTNPISFTKQRKSRASKTKLPGPGTYSHFSQFGK